MKAMFDKLKLTVSNYYITLILFMVSTMILIYSISNSYNSVVDNVNIKLILTFIYGAILSFIVKEAIDRLDFKLKKLIYILVPLLMAFVYYILLGELESFTNAVKYFLLSFLTVITAFSIPFIGKSEDSEYYSYKVLISLSLTMLCFFVLVFGLFFILMSVSTLFEITVKDYIYGDIFFGILGIFMPALFISLLPNKDTEEVYPEFINKMILYVIYPILTVYTVVLYAYFIKVLINFNMPSNMLGNLTIYYLIISVVVLYFSSKLNDINKWSNKFINSYPNLLIVPSIMMLLTFLTRINTYGFTEARYYGLLLFVFSIGSIVLVKMNNKVKYIPILLSTLLLVSIIGPLSSFNVSISSQENRFEELLNKNNMIKDNEVVINESISSGVKQQVYDMLTYFSDRDSLDKIDVLPKGFEIDEDMEKIFGFSNVEYYHY